MTTRCGGRRDYARARDRVQCTHRVQRPIAHNAKRPRARLYSEFGDVGYPEYRRMSEQPYSRVYWSVMDDAKFDGIREDPRHFGAWCLLLIVADMAFPAPAFPPPTVSRASMKALTEAGLVDRLSGGRFRIHGLETERAKRSQYGRNAAEVRWHGKRNADPVLDETRRDKQRLDEASDEKTPQPPASGGTGLRADGDSRRQRAEAFASMEREQRRQEAMALQQRYLRGEIQADEYERLKADIGKEPDDLTRLSVVRP
jgi:hypothetical protein